MINPKAWRNSQGITLQSRHGEKFSLKASLNFINFIDTVHLQPVINSQVAPLRALEAAEKSRSIRQDRLNPFRTTKAQIQSLELYLEF